MNGTGFCLYGDSACNRRWFMEVPFEGRNMTPSQRAFNKAMPAVRIAVVWVFKDIKQYLTMVNNKRKIKLMQGPVGTMY